MTSDKAREVCNLLDACNVSGVLYKALEYLQEARSRGDNHDEVHNDVAFRMALYKACSLVFPGEILWTDTVYPEFAQDYQQILDSVGK